MSAKRYVSEAQRTLDAPRALVWALVSDTNRGDRALGLAAATYRWDKDAAGRQVRVASAREMGVALEWIEPPYRWIEGRYLAGRRDFTKGPVAAGTFEAILEDASDGKTLLTVRAAVYVGGFLRFLIGPFQRAKFRRALARYLAGIEAVLRDWRGAAPEASANSEPAAAHARRLLAASYEPVANGPRTAPDLAILEPRAQRLRDAGVDPAVVERLVAHLRDRPDEEVSQMRPFELARVWDLPPRAVLRGFLHATIAGLTDLRWQINCPVCRVGASVVSDLASVGETSHCAACQIHYDTDFAQHVEAVFPCNGAVRPVYTALYCASSPTFLPHVMAQIFVAAGETVEHPIDLPDGPLHLRVLGRPGGADVGVDRAPARVDVAVAADGTIAARPSGTADAASVLHLTNATDEDAYVLVERAGWAADAVLGTVIASFPEFLDLFATEAPASGVDLQVGHLALLFSDLVGSTALYERVGDARAFAIVEEHFRVVGRVVADHGGAIVKTMGDAVMASFPSLREAVAAGKGMIAAHRAVHVDDGLGVKLGVHAGPCLAVRANERLDFFGTTVNMAARLQAQAASAEIVLTAESASDATVVPLLTGLPRRRFSANLKGIEAPQELVGIDCAGLALRDEAAAEE